MNIKKFILTPVILFLRSFSLFAHPTPIVEISNGTASSETPKFLVEFHVGNITTWPHFVNCAQKGGMERYLARNNYNFTELNPCPANFTDFDAEKFNLMSMRQVDHISDPFQYTVINDENEAYSDDEFYDE